MSGGELTMLVALAVTIGLLAGLYPAWRAAHLPPALGTKPA